MMLFCDQDAADDRAEESALGTKSRLSGVSSLLTDVTDEAARQTRMASSQLQVETTPMVEQQESEPIAERQVSRVQVKSPVPDEDAAGKVANHQINFTGMLYTL